MKKYEESNEIKQMREDFASFYDNDFKNDLQSIESDRKKFLIYFMCLASVATLIAAVLFYLLWRHYLSFLPEILLLIALPPITLFVICPCVYICGKPVKSFNEQSQQIIMKKFISFFEGFKYDKKGRININKIRRSKIIDFFTKRKHDDYFEGVYKNTKVKISEESFVEDQGKWTHDAYKGLLVEFDIGKPLSGVTTVIKNRGFFKFIYDNGRFEKFTTENITFESKFEVYTDDKNEAKSIFNNEFIEKILMVKSLFENKNIAFSFFDNSILIAIRSHEDLFKTSSLFMPTTNHKYLAKTFNLFLSILSIIEVLDLSNDSFFYDKYYKRLN